MIRHKILLSSFIFYLFSMAPVALADDECGASASVTCPAGNYADGITYNSNVDLDLTTLGGIHVSDEGMNLTGTGTASLTVDLTGEVDGDGDITLTTNSGAIALDHMGSDDGSITAISNTGGITINGGNADGGLVLQTGGLMSVSNNDIGDVNVNSASGNRLELNMTGHMQGSLPTEDYDAQIPSLRFEFANMRSGVLGDMTGLTGGTELNFGAHTSWITGNNTLLSNATDVVNTAENSIVYAQLTDHPNWFGVPDDDITDDRFVLNFGDGEDEFNMGGLLLVGAADAGERNPERRSRTEAELRLENLEIFNHGGVIYLGADTRVGTGGDKIFGTDTWADDILSFPGGTHFHGEGGRILIDANLNHTAANGQTGACDASSRNALGDLPTADCIDLRGGQATGRSYFIVRQAIQSDRGAYNPEGIMLVDVSGASGDNDPEAFSIAPEDPQYSPAGGGVLDKGLFVYSVGYDADAEQYRLYGVEAPASQQFALFGHIANGLWRTSAASWFDRQVSERDADRGTAGNGGFWLRAGSTSAEHDVIDSVMAGVNVLEFDNSYQRDDRTLTFGLDMLTAGSSDISLVLGTMVGYARSEVDFDRSANTMELEGMHGGFYGSLIVGDFFVDAALNGTWVDLHNDVPALRLFPEGTILDTDVVSYGAQVEAGWRLAWGRFGIEPLAGLSYVMSDFESLNIPADDPGRFGGNVEFDDPTSLRASLGARLTAKNVIPNFVPVDLGLTARAVQETDGESKVAIENIGPNVAAVENTFDGTFGEVTGTAKISNRSRTAVGYLNVDGTFGDDYESLGFSAGFRYQW